jgi:mannose-6-phosphate isomerase-like protein (cupin superfamily)
MPTSITRDDLHAAPPGRAVELHVHPCAETFLLLAGHGRWTRGEETVELEPEGMLVVPPDTPHGFRNIGDAPLLAVSVHELADRSSFHP